MKLLTIAVLAMLAVQMSFLTTTAQGGTNERAVPITPRQRKMATTVVRSLTTRFINSDFYPQHDEQSGIGQMTAVQYCGPSNDAPARLTGFVVSRIITDRSGGKNHGEKWCLVEFGSGPPWKTCPLSSLVPMPCSKALKDFPAKGIETMKAMLGIERDAK